MSAIHDPNRLNATADAILFIAEHNAIDELRSWLRSARHEFNEQNISPSDQRWQERDPLASYKHYATVMAELTDAPPHLCVSAMHSQYFGSWTEFAFDEIQRFVRYLKSQPYIAQQVRQAAAKERFATRQKAGVR
jgi:hypothetical protein